MYNSCIYKSYLTYPVMHVVLVYDVTLLTPQGEVITITIIPLLRIRYWFLSKVTTRQDLQEIPEQKTSLL